MSWLPKKSVVVPVDFSKSSLHAIDVALQLVDDPSHLHVIHVTQPIHVAEPGMIWGTVDDETRVKAAKDALEHEIAPEIYEKIDSKVVVGLPAQSIVELAQDVEADLIVIPSHGRSGVKRFLLGSVTEKVLRLSHCATLVLRVGEDED
jgi:nucleotide-binding universal stress UspA family protein